MYPVIQAALLIFSLRVVGISLNTLRILLVFRGRKVIAWIIAFIQAGLFALVLGAVFSSLDNWLVMSAYAAGFATGNVAGMYLESLLAIGYTHLRIISPGRGEELAERIRDQGYAVTEVAGHGRDGTVTILNCTIKRKEAARFTNFISGIDGAAFVTAEDVRLVWRGYLPRKVGKISLRK